MNIPAQKLKAIILYFCEKTEPKFLGKVKLMKLFYYLDFAHVKKYGCPVTFDNYVKLEHGPIPSVIKNMVDDAECDPDVSVLSDIINIEHKEGTEMHRIVPRRKLQTSDVDLLSKTEIEVLDNICQRFGEKNTDFIEQASHKESPWLKSAMYMDIPYTMAAQDKDCLVDEDTIKFCMQIFKP